MELKELKCPECGATIESNEKISFCSHCGAKLFFDDGTRNLNYNYKAEDIAKIKEIETNREIELKQMKEKSRFTENKWILTSISGYVIFFLILWAVMIYSQDERPLEKQFWMVVIVYIVFYITICLFWSNQSKTQELELKRIVNEIYTDINAGNYEVALIKTKSLYYTAKWSNDIKEKWDDTRETLIKIIEEKMK